MWTRYRGAGQAEFYTYLFFAVTLVIFRRCFLVLQIIIVIGCPVIIGILSEDNMRTSYEFGVIRCIYGFAAGVLVWWAYCSWRTVISKWLANPIVACSIEIAMVVLVVFFVSTARTETVSLIAPYVFSAAVFLFAFEAGWVSRILSRWPMVALGALSYSIYMV